MLFEYRPYPFKIDKDSCALTGNVQKCHKFSDSSRVSEVLKCAVKYSTFSAAQIAGITQLFCPLAKSNNERHRKSADELQLFKNISTDYKYYVIIVFFMLYNFNMLP